MYMRLLVHARLLSLLVQVGITSRRAGGSSRMGGVLCVGATQPCTGSAPACSDIKCSDIKWSVVAEQQPK
jgi:hypothetical protein